MKLKITVDKHSVNDTAQNLEAIVTGVHYGAKWATERACQDIEAMSLEQVPIETGTLAASIGHVVEKRSSKRFVGIVSYGNGNHINPRSGEAAQDYMVRQHEDLEYVHTVGKAKYLEDPCRAYADSDRYAALLAEAAQRAIKRNSKR